LVMMEVVVIELWCYKGSGGGRDWGCGETSDETRVLVRVRAMVELAVVRT